MKTKHVPIDWTIMFRTEDFINIFERNKETENWRKKKKKKEGEVAKIRC